MHWRLIPSSRAGDPCLAAIHDRSPLRGMFLRVAWFRNYMKDGVLPRDTLELLDRRVTVHRNVRPGSRGAFQVTAQDRGPLAQIHLLQVDQLAGTMAHDRAPAR